MTDTATRPAPRMRQLGPPTWTKLLPAFFAVMENGTDEGKRIARQELARMAQAADLWNAANADADTDQEPTQ